MQNIQWFPGHMAKAKREILEKIKLVDLIIELKDARIPNASTNPLIDEIVGKKPRLILLCKSSIADQSITKKWIDYYAAKSILAIDIDSITNYHIKEVIGYCKQALKDVFETRKRKGIVSEQIRAMILGIPNVGKSTLINTLAKRKAAAVGDRPGVTKSQTWIKVTDSLQLLDTPGILWPKFDDQEVAVKLAMCGSIKDEIIDIEQLTIQSIEYLSKHYPAYLMKRYELEALASDSYQVLKDIGSKRGCLLKGGVIDTLKASIMFMNELRGNKIGAMSYEEPGQLS